MQPALLLLSLCAAGLLLGQTRAFAVHQGCYVAAEDGVQALPFRAAAADSSGSGMMVETCRCGHRPQPSSKLTQAEHC